MFEHLINGFRIEMEKLAATQKELEVAARMKATEPKKSYLLNALGGTVVGTILGVAVNHPLPIVAGLILGLLRARGQRISRERMRDILLMPEKQRDQELDKLDVDKHWFRGVIGKQDIQKAKKLEKFGA